MFTTIEPMAEVVLIRDFDISRNCGTVVETGAGVPATVEKGCRIYFKPGTCSVITAGAVVKLTMFGEIKPMDGVVHIREVDTTRGCGTVMEKDGDVPEIIENGSRVYYKPGACTEITAGAVDKQRMLGPIEPMANVVLIPDFESNRNCGTVVETGAGVLAKFAKGNLIFFKPGACTVITPGNMNREGLVKVEDILAMAPVDVASTVAH